MPAHKADLNKMIHYRIMKFLRKIDIGKINIDTIRGVSSKKPILIDGKSASTSSGNHQKVIKKINKR